PPHRDPLQRPLPPGRRRPRTAGRLRRLPARAGALRHSATAADGSRMTKSPNPYGYPPPPYAPRLVCPQCGTELSPALLACPGCQRLVHADRLNQLAAEARAADDAGDVSTSLARWREAL